MFARSRPDSPLVSAAMSKTRRGQDGGADDFCDEGVAGAEEPGDGGAEAVAGAGESSGCPPLSAVLEALESQVPRSAERDKVLDAGRHMASGANQKVVRSLAGKWNVQQKVGGVNRGTTDILNEVQDNVRRAAVLLLQNEEMRGVSIIMHEGMQKYGLDITQLRNTSSE